MADPHRMDHLTSHLLAALAEKVCRRYGVKPPLPQDISKLYQKYKITPPLILTTETATVWIDRWYVAAERNCDDVEYLYLTRHHIVEETMSYRELKKYRQDPPELPGHIRKQFRTAVSAMKAGGQNIWFSKAAEDLGLSWIGVWHNTKDHTEGENAYV